MDSSGKQLYFVYGVLMHPERMVTCCAAPAAVAVARLGGHELVFHGQSQVWDGGEEALAPCAGSEVWGVVYALSALDAQRLDAALGVREDGGGLYFLSPAEVVDLDGREHAVLLHVRDMLGDPALPSTEYLRVLVEGARLRGLPAAYTAHLQSLPSRRAAFAVPRQTLFDPLKIAGGDPCASCG